ncbi:ATPase, T2SS/T4P/T4SS family [Orrella sp. JC864]|uniref:ATPase, T2SS/T4P/T4SS family n=1 Tax=Orrella sp. JC864 TaxID=3120298 RepID=UPI003009F053
MSDVIEMDPGARGLCMTLHFQDGSVRQEAIGVPCVIGREAKCDVRIRHWRVARTHARLDCVDAGLVLEDLGSLAGTSVNGKRIARYGPLRTQDEIVIGPCLIRLALLRSGQGSNPGGLSGSQPAGAAQAAAPAGLQEAAQAYAAGQPAHRPGLPGGTDAPAAGDAPAPPASLPASSTACGCEPADTRGGQDWAAQPASTPAPSSPASGPASPPAGEPGQRQALRQALLEALDLRRRDVSSMSDAMLRAEAAAQLQRIVAELPGPSRPDPALVRAVLDEAVGLGPLEPLLADPGITEIMVNRHDEIYVERAGRLVREAASFSDEQSLLGVIEKIVTPLGRRIDESSPLVDARLPDGSRVHAVIAPVALKGAALTLRKFPQRRPGMQDLVAGHALDGRMAAFLALCVQRRKNIVVAGGTGSGKTTLINVLSHCVPEGERIVTIEDAAELRLQHDHLISLEARPPNLEGRGAVTIRELVRNALRMRPDRIIVGECRGAEAFDMLAAMNTGHEGSLTSLHANSARDALARLETMILMAGMSLPLQAVREHIASSIDLIVQQSRLSNGRRLVSAIVEVTGMESGCIQLQEIYHYDRRGDVFRASGLVPQFVDGWREQGAGCDMALFAPGLAPGQGRRAGAPAAP